MSIRASTFVFILAVSALVSASCAGGRPAGAPSTGGPTLRVGDPAPEFTLPLAKGGSVSLGEFRGNKQVLLYFSMGPG